LKKLHLFKEFTIASYNADVHGKATLQALLQFLQEIAWEHAEHLDLGFTKLYKQNLLWVLVRQKIKVAKFPNWPNSVKVKTWATGKDILFWYRDFKIFDSDDSEIAKATSSWMIINLETRRPHRAENLFNIPIEKPDFASETKLGKLPSVKDVTRRYEKEVRYSDLDLNDHVNNVKYLEWVLDSYPLQRYKKNRIESVELNYMAEAIYGDRIFVNSDLIEPFHLHSIKREPDNKELFRAKIDWLKS